MANPTITQFTTPVPTRNDPANFSDRANTLVSELPQFVEGANAVADWINDQAGEIATTASEVDNNRTLAQSAATSAGNNAAAVEAARAEVEDNAEQVATDRAVVEAAADGALASHVDPDYATADANKGGYGEGDIVLVLSDTNYDDAATYYELDTGALAFLGLADGFNTSAYPHLAQNKSIHFWINKLLAKTGESIQATPSLELDFENDVYKVEGESKTFAEAITYTRASDATLHKASGKLATVSTDEPQFEYDTVTKERYLLLEPARTNLLTYSEQLDHINWTKDDCTITADAAVFIDGNIVMDKVIANTNSALHRFKQQVSATSGEKYTASVFLKAADYDEFSITFFSTGSQNSGSVIVEGLAGSSPVVTNGGANHIAHGIQYIGNGVYRIWVAIEANFTGSLSALYTMRNNSLTTFVGDDVSGIFAGGAQLEEGAFPTSYIKTEASTVTRAESNPSLAVGDWFNPEEGTIFVDAEPAKDDAGFFFTLGDGTAGRVSARASLGNADNITCIYDAGASSPNDAIVKGDGNLSRLRLALSYRNGAELAASLNGDFDTRAVSAPFDDAAAIANWYIGYAGPADTQTAALIYEMRYYPKALTEAQLVALTSGAA